MHRLFVAIRPPEDVRDLLIDAMDDSPALRWVGDEQLHLTLRFIGEVERPTANDIAGALSRLHSPRFDLRVIDVASRKLTKTLKSGQDPEACARSQDGSAIDVSNEGAA